jgi:hypothetical protein
MDRFCKLVGLTPGLAPPLWAGILGYPGLDASIQIQAMGLGSPAEGDISTKIRPASLWEMIDRVLRSHDAVFGNTPMTAQPTKLSPSRSRGFHGRRLTGGDPQARK